MDIPFDTLFLNHRQQREILLSNAPCSRTRDGVSRLLDDPALAMMKINTESPLSDEYEFSLKEDEAAYESFEISTYTMLPVMQCDSDWTTRYLHLAVPIVALFLADILERPILQEIFDVVKAEGLHAVGWAYTAQAAALDPIGAVEFLANERHWFPGTGVLRGIINAPASLSVGAAVAVGFLAYKMITEPSRKEKLHNRLNELLDNDSARHAFWKGVGL
ncbi:hypothetical protein FRC17_009659 [Serendipita sp. 399]|nr:hypothetical protein FRC17_009659 [Serendipita sp. 399]